MRLKLEEIIIPEHMLAPNDHRLREAIRHVGAGTLYPLEVKRTDEGHWLLVDGYARYLAVKECGHDAADIKVCE